MAERPINMHGALLVLDYWRPNTCFQTFQISVITIWVQIRLIPDDYFDYHNLHHLIQTLGDIQSLQSSSYMFTVGGYFSNFRLIIRGILVISSK
ncbi:hypothetical protein LIER_28559 [Lithospermum erythrorhizon]|uniref:DUF4283 domain-containing protein n=1 Tax=Lithospermum erythrorhizon TaxID=34254 RepID=A0AAV3RHP9_LITER